MSVAFGNVPKISPQSAVDQTLEVGEEVFYNDRTRRAKATPPDDLAAIYPAHQARWEALHPG